MSRMNITERNSRRRSTGVTPVGSRSDTSLVPGLPFGLMPLIRAGIGAALARSRALADLSRASTRRGLLRR